MHGGARSRRRLVALVVYYAVVIVLVGPMLRAQAGAAVPSPVPARVSLNFALRTPSTDVATFTTPFPITVGVASNGSFTIPRGHLAFALVEVPMPAPNAALGRLTVRAQAMSDFAGTYDHATGAVTLDGSLLLLWSQPKPAVPSTAPRMVNCPVGPFALHLSTATVGGVQLNPTSRAARLVDDELDVAAVPNGTPQCAGDEAGLNAALSLPITPKPVVTTTTTTTTTVPDPSTTTIEATTTTTDSTTTTTIADPPTTVASDPAALIAATDGAAPPIDPQVLAFEPIPSIVSTMTIAPVPAPIATTTTTAPFVVNTPRTIPQSTPSHTARHETHHKAKTHKKAPAKHHRKNKHAQTTVLAPPVVGPPRTATGPFSWPFNFAPTNPTTSHNPLTAPLATLSDNVARHATGLSILFVALLVAPLVTFGLGLVASDLGWRPPFLARRRRRANGRKVRVSA